METKVLLNIFPFLPCPLTLAFQLYKVANVIHCLPHSYVTEITWYYHQAVALLNCLRLIIEKEASSNY